MKLRCVPEEDGRERGVVAFPLADTLGSSSTIGLAATSGKNQAFCQALPRVLVLRYSKGFSISGVWIPEAGLVACMLDAGSAKTPFGILEG